MGGSSGGSGWPAGDVVGVLCDGPADGLEVVETLAGAAFRAVALEVVVTAQVLVGHAAGQHVEGGDQDRVPDRLAGAGFTAPTDEAGVLPGEVGVLGTAGGHRSDGEVALQPAVAVPGPPGAGLAGRLVLARAHTGPGRQPRGAAEPGHVYPDLGDQRLAEALIDAGDGGQEVTLGCERGDHLLDAGADPGRSPPRGSRCGPGSPRPPARGSVRTGRSAPGPASGSWLVVGRGPARRARRGRGYR